MPEHSKQFLVHSPTRDLQEFRGVAEQAARLKAHGRVLVNISATAKKAFHEIPEGGSGWHEYAVNSPSIHRVFPHPLIAPHVPAEFVQANQKLLLGKAAILRELGLDAYFWAVEPFFLPESFFEQHPELRGPRVDHPRRSRREEFSLCVDLPQTQEMYRWMVGELRKAVPHLRAYVFKTNDAGGSLCWAAALYSGRSGPAHCEHLSPGQHVANFAGALRSGAKSDEDFTVFVGHSNFWDNEIYDIAQHLPPGVVLTDRNDSIMAVGSLLSQTYPVRGMFNPLAILRSMEQYHRSATRTVFVDFRAHYDRCCEQLPAVTRVLDLVDLSIREPALGLLPRLNQLRGLCAKWTSPSSVNRPYGNQKSAGSAASAPADALLQAFVDLDQAMFLRQNAIPGFGTTPAISVRHVTRPLVFDPSRLSPDEESYFLPYVFNVSLDEARSDYIDMHGGRLAENAAGARSVPAMAGVQQLLKSAAAAFDRAAASGEDWLAKFGASIRIYASLLRSVRNFYLAQHLRDEHRDKKGAAITPHEKTPSKLGEGRHLDWISYLRDELDNTTELIALVGSGALSQIHHADDDSHQDCFVLGPNLLADLKRKAQITRRHWRDVEDFLAPPNK